MRTGSVTGTMTATQHVMRPISHPASAVAASASRTSLLVYLGFALLAAAADLITKQIATSTIAIGDVIPMIDRLSLMVVYNTGSAGGVMIGPYTWHYNVLVTFAALVLITVVAPSLIAIDRTARLSLGLVAGGAIGNLASMLFGPEGVADFLALRLRGDTTIVMNVADLELWVGALLLLPVVMTLIRAIRAERTSAMLAEG